MPARLPLVSLLRPRSGRRLPPALQPQAAYQSGIELSDGLASSSFAGLLSGIDGGATIHSGNRVQLFFAGIEAMDAMVAAIQGAEREVLIESYIFRDDDTGVRFQRELQRAAERGLAVRVLADAFGS